MKDFENGEKRRRNKRKKERESKGCHLWEKNPNETEVPQEIFPIIIRKEKNVESPETQPEPTIRVKEEKAPRIETPQLQKTKQLSQGFNDGVVNVFRESIFSVPAFGREITAVTMITRNLMDIGEIFAEYPKDLVVLVTPGQENERFVSLVLNRNSKIQDKPVLVRLLVRELGRMDQSVKDGDKEWRAKEKNLVVSGFTALPVKIFLETLALCFEKIEPESQLNVADSLGEVSLVATV